MVLFNYSTKELTAKIVYYGPGLCGKTTNLQYIFDNLPANIHKGKMLSLATKTDRTLFFDFLPIDLGTIRGMRTRLQLYTVPGQVFYNTTRKLVLKGADGLVFVADSQKKMLDANTESFGNMEQNLREHGMELTTIPHVLQFNKRDLKDILSVEELNATLNKHNVPIYEAVATTGIGVQDTLKAVTRLVLNSLREKYSEGRKAPAQRAATTASAARPARPPSAPAPIEVADAGPVLELDDSSAAPPASEPEPVLAVAADDVVEVEEAAEEVPVLEMTEEEIEEVEIVEEPADSGLDISSPLSLGEPEEQEGLDSIAVSPATPSLDGEPAVEIFDLESAPEAPAARRGRGKFDSDSGAYELPSPLEEPALDGATVAIDFAPEAKSAASPAAVRGARATPEAAARKTTFPLDVEIQGRIVRLEVTISIRVEKS